MGRISPLRAPNHHQHHYRFADEGENEGGEQDEADNQIPVIFFPRVGLKVRIKETEV